MSTKNFASFHFFTTRGEMHMTLSEMSHQYAADAEIFARRICQLQRQANVEPDPEAKLQLERRILALRPLLRQSRELAYITAHYYDREDHKNEQYPI